MRRAATFLLMLAFSNPSLAQELSLRSLFQITGGPGKGLENPASFSFDAFRERILVANTGAGTVEVFTAGGEFLFRIGESGGLSAPVGVAALSSGRLVILQEKKSVLEIYGEATQKLDSFNLASVDSSGKIRPNLVFADGKDNLYFLDAGNKHVLVLDSELKKKVQIGASGRGKLRHPAFLAVDQSGKCYVADELDCPIRVFDPKGRFLTCLPKNPAVEERYWRPAGICIDAKNRLWTIDADASALRVYDASGNLIQTMVSADGGNRPFFFPVQMSVDRYGQLYLLEKGKNAIAVFQIENY